MTDSPSADIRPGTLVNGTIGPDLPSRACCRDERGMRACVAIWAQHPASRTPSARALSWRDVRARREGQVARHEHGTAATMMLRILRAALNGCAFTLRGE